MCQSFEFREVFARNYEMIVISIIKNQIVILNSFFPLKEISRIVSGGMFVGVIDVGDNSFIKKSLILEIESQSFRKKIIGKTIYRA
jgi:hypothetical protein